MSVVTAQCWRNCSPSAAYMLTETVSIHTHSEIRLSTQVRQKLIAVWIKSKKVNRHFNLPIWGVLIRLRNLVQAPELKFSWKLYIYQQIQEKKDLNTKFRRVFMISMFSICKRKLRVEEKSAKATLSTKDHHKDMLPEIKKNLKKNRHMIFIIMPASLNLHHCLNATKITRRPLGKPVVLPSLPLMYTHILVSMCRTNLLLLNWARSA